MIKLVCPECQHQNEPERIYCHDCGARLDRSALAKVAPKLEDPKQTQQRLKRMLDPGRLRLRLMFFKIGKLLVGACVLAGLIQMLLPPDNLPERIKTLELQQISLDLENATAHHGAPLRYTEAEVNAYFASVVKSKQAALSRFLQFERALANFDEGVCRITVERSLLGFSIFQSSSYNVAVREGTLTASISGGSIGRMPIHPMIMTYGGNFLFADLWAALDREKKLVSKMGAIEFHPKTVILIPNPAVPAPEG